jgi:hypothetical protein
MKYEVFTAVEIHIAFWITTACSLVDWYHVVPSSETLAPTYRTTRCHKPEDHNVNQR